MGRVPAGRSWIVSRRCSMSSNSCGAFFTPSSSSIVTTATPERVVDVQALAGDSTDNVPGAPGIGLKTAAQLILEYGDLETLLSRAGEIKQPKRREALTDPEIVKRIMISKQLVTLDRDVPVDTPLYALATPKLDGKRLIAFFKAMELTTLTRRAAEICGIDAASVEPEDLDRQQNILHDGPPRKENGRLKHHADVAPRSLDVHPTDGDPAGGRLDESSDQLQ